MTTNYKIAISGLSGKMGQAILRLMQEDETLSHAQGADPLNAESLFAQSDAVIDFSTPSFTKTLAECAAKTGKPLISGTTGLDDCQKQALQKAAQHAPILHAANMSLHVNLLSILVEQTARALDEENDIEIIEMHHSRKVDAPSGTALMLGESAAKGRGHPLREKAVTTRDGITGAREAGSIGFATLRGGDVVGEHSVLFATSGERIELSHKATNRDIFARGALKATRWIQGKPAGFYSMRDVLGL